MTGRWLGIHGEASPDLLDDLLGGTVRLPASLTAAATKECRPLDGWRDHPWLRYSRALILGPVTRRRSGHEVCATTTNSGWSSNESVGLKRVPPV
ncbi:hypothetical protein AB0B25_05300 [Nocardia sp. NPDC049190]|uniref:hypothetical protein n=1 Tax=Nocardia sp. NPDC049190 TaxID=3155650 RepID=UPI0033D56BB2